MSATTRKIATFNVNGIHRRLSHLLEWLQREQPDIVGLQELKATQEAFPEQAIGDAGYGVIWQGEKSWNGVAFCWLCTARRRSTPSGTIFASILRVIAACVSIIYCSIARWRLACRMPAWTRGCALWKKPAITRRPGSACVCRIPL